MTPFNELFAKWAKANRIVNVEVDDALNSTTVTTRYINGGTQPKGLVRRVRLCEITGIDPDALFPDDPRVGSPRRTSDGHGAISERLDEFNLWLWGNNLEPYIRDDGQVRARIVTRVEL